MILKFLNKNVGFILSITVIILVSILYFTPALEDYVLQQGDVSSHRAMAKEFNDALSHYDIITQWTGTSFSGMPNYTISSKNDNYVFDYSIGRLSYFLTYFIAYFIIGMLTFYILSYYFTKNHIISVALAISYAFVTYNIDILQAGHTTKLAAISNFPGVILGIVMMFKDRRIWLSIFVFMLFMYLEIASFHIQMTYYLMFPSIAILVGILIQAVKNKNLLFIIKRGLISIICLIIVVMANYNVLFVQQKYVKHTMRGDNIISISPNGVQENNKDQSKGGLDRSYITNWSYGKQEALNLFIPNAKGNMRTVTNTISEKMGTDFPNERNKWVGLYQQTNGQFGGYYGEQPFTGAPNYIGSLVIFLALLYFFTVKSPYRIPLIITSLLVLLLGMGKNLGGLENMHLTNFFIDYFPLYNKFRAVTSIYVALNLIMPLMAALFLSKAIEKDWLKENFKKISIVSGIIGGILLIFIMMPNILEYTSGAEDKIIKELQQKSIENGQIFDLQSTVNAVTSIRKEVFVNDVIRTLLILGLGFFALFIIKTNDKLKTFALIGLSIIIVYDIMSIDINFINKEKKEGSDDYQLWVKNEENNNTNLVETQADIQIYNTELQKNPEIKKQFEEKINSLRSEGKELTNTDILNLKYMYLNFNTNYRALNLDNPFNDSKISSFHKTTGGYNPAKLKRYQDIIDFYISKEFSYLNQNKLSEMKVLNMLNNKYYIYNGFNQVIENTYAQGNAWFIKGINWVDDNNSEILAIANTNLQDSIILHKEYKEMYKNDFAYDSNATVKLLNYLPNNLIYESNSTTNSVIAFSEVFYSEDWEVTIDGKPAEFSRANYIIRAMPIPKGKHKIEFHFENKTKKMGDLFNLVFALFMLILLATAIYFQFKNNKKLELDNKI